MRRKINRDPLRKIVGLKEVYVGNDGEYKYYSFDEELECGHTQPQRQDMFGTTNAVRRRCEKCGTESKAE